MPSEEENPDLGIEVDKWLELDLDAQVIDLEAIAQEGKDDNAPHPFAVDVVRILTRKYRAKIRLETAENLAGKIQEAKYELIDAQTVQRLISPVSAADAATLLGMKVEQFVDNFYPTHQKQCEGKLYFTHSTPDNILLFDVLSVANFSGNIKKRVYSAIFTGLKISPKYWEDVSTSNFFNIVESILFSCEAVPEDPEEDVEYIEFKEDPLRDYSTGDLTIGPFRKIARPFTRYQLTYTQAAVVLETVDPKSTERSFRRMLSDEESKAKRIMGDVNSGRIVRREDLARYIISGEKEGLFRNDESAQMLARIGYSSNGQDTSKKR